MPLHTLCKSLSFIYNGLGIACGASERFDVVSDLLRVGPGGRLLHGYVLGR